MISYEIYKLIHLLCLLLFSGTIGLILYPEHLLDSKKGKFFTGFVSFFILVSGMGLVARLGFKHTEAFPLWITLKMLNWLAMNIALFFTFRSKSLKNKMIFSLIIFILAVTNIWLAINKIQ
jgi:uncharacterized membrane protein SirB2